MTALSPVRLYYTPYEVAKHNTPSDCWVSFLGEVHDVSKLLKENGPLLCTPLIKAAGTDISHWFDSRTKGVRTHVDPVTNLIRPYCPQGRFIHVPPSEPLSNWATDFRTPWWKDKQYWVGHLSQRTRTVRIKNVLTGQEDMLEVPCEEKLIEIRERYLELNWHAKSYTWRALVIGEAGEEAVFKELELNSTLEENRVVDETRTFEDLMIPTDYFVPVLHCYWNDDLTVA